MTTSLAPATSTRLRAGTGAALQTEMSRLIATRARTTQERKRYGGEVTTIPTATRATVVVAGTTYTASSVGMPVAVGSAVTLEWGSALPRIVAVHSGAGSGGSTVLAAPPSIPGDDLAAWVEDHLVPALVAAGVVTLA